MRTRTLRVVLALAIAVSTLTAVVAAQLIGSESSSASSAAVYAFTGGSNPALPFTPPSTEGVDDIEGLFSKTYTDISVPGLGPALDLTRTYDSGGTGGFDVPTFGSGWAFSYDMVVDVGSGTTTPWVVIQENGSPADFTSCPTTKSGSCTNTSGQDDVSLSFNVTSNTYTFTRGEETFTFALDEPDEKSQYNLTKITDPNGYSTTVNWSLSAPNSQFEYGELQLQSVTDAEGRSITFAYNSAGYISSAKDPMGRVTTYSYSATTPAYLRSVTQPDGEVTSFTGDTGDEGLLATITDPNGGVTSLTYCTEYLGSCGGFATPNLTIASITDPMGLTTTFSYAENTEYNKEDEGYCEAQTTITDPHGEVSTNTLIFPVEQSCAGLEAQDIFTLGSNLGSAAASTTYNFSTSNQWQPTSVADANGHTTSYTYNSNGEVATSTDPLTNKTSYTYNSFDEVLTTTDPLGIVETNTFDSDGNLTKKVLTADSSCSSNCTLTATYTVCESATCTVGSNKYIQGETESATDPDGHVTDYTYDSYGDVATTITSPSSGVTDTTQDVYDADAELVCQASPNAVAAGTTCPPAGSPRVAGTTTSVYNSDGQLTSTTDADGNTTSYTYDHDGNQTSVADGLGNVTETTYDKDDRVSTVTDGYGSSSATTTTYAYDIAASSCPSAPTGTLWCTQKTDGLGNTTISYYNGLDDLIEVAPPNTTAQTPTTYTYDGVGNVLSMTNGSGTTTNTYDADNHLTGISYSNTATGITTPHSVTYSYDADGNRTKMVDGTGTTTYTYDGFERLISDKDGAGNTVTYGYDADSNVVCLSYPNSGSTTCQNASSGTGLVTYTFNGAGQLTQMSDWLGNTTKFGYDADGNLTSTTLPSGTSTTVSDAYDATDALTDTSVTTSGTKTDLAGLTRNADENIATTNAPVTTYGYDPLNRVTTGTTASYGYDNDSDLTAITPSGGSTTTQVYNPDNQLCWSGVGSGACGSAPSGATTYTYNSAGERTATTAGASGAVTSYGWDQAGNLVCETASNTSGLSCTNQNSSLTSTYGYNGNGLRMSATPAGASTEQFTWSTVGTNPQLLEDGTNFYLYGPSVGTAPIEQIKQSGSTPSYLVSDTTGVRDQINSSGTVTGTMTYDSFGNQCSSCSISTPFGFEGAYTDSTGLVYLIHRYYDSATGQFLSIDPMLLTTPTAVGTSGATTTSPNNPGGNSGTAPQPYVYVGGDPVNDVDLNGECFLAICTLWNSFVAFYHQFLLSPSGALYKWIDSNWSSFSRALQSSVMYRNGLVKYFLQIAQAVDAYLEDLGYENPSVAQILFMLGIAFGG